MGPYLPLDAHACEMSIHCTTHKIPIISFLKVCLNLIHTAHTAHELLPRGVQWCAAGHAHTPSGHAPPLSSSTALIWTPAGGGSGPPGHTSPHSPGSGGWGGDVGAVRAPPSIDRVGRGWSVRSEGCDVWCVMGVRCEVWGMCTPSVYIHCSLTWL